MNAAVIEHLLRLQPFRRFWLVVASQHEYDVTRPSQLKLIGELDVVVWSGDRTTNFIDLKSIGRIRVEDDFGPNELDRMLNEFS